MPGITQKGVEIYTSSPIVKRALYVPCGKASLNEFLPGDTYKTSPCSGITSKLTYTPVFVDSPVSSLTASTSIVSGSKTGMFNSVNWKGVSVFALAGIA